MRLSIWHCKTLYVMTRLDLKKVSEVGEVSINLLAQTAKSENWDRLKFKFASLPKDRQSDFEYLELLIGDFRTNESHVAYVNGILTKLHKKVDANIANNQDTYKSDVKTQLANRLIEYGMDSHTATAMIDDMESILVESKKDIEDFLTIDASLSIQEKLDTMNAGYRFLTQYFEDSASEMHDQLREQMRYIHEIIMSIRSTTPASLSYEDRLSSLRYLTYGFQAYGNLARVRGKLTGTEHYVNHHAPLAKVVGKEYMLVPRDELGRLSGDNS